MVVKILNIVVKKLLICSLIIPSVLAADSFENNNNELSFRMNAKVPASSQSFDQCYVSDNPPLCMVFRKIVNSFYDNVPVNTMPAALQLPNLFRGFPWMNQTQKCKHP